MIVVLSATFNGSREEKKGGKPAGARKRIKRMKLTKSQLKKIIKEEIDAVVKEDETMSGPLNKLAFALRPGEVEDLVAKSLKGAPQALLDRIGKLTSKEILHAMAVATGVETGLPLDRSAYGDGETSTASRVMAKAVGREFPQEEGNE